VQVEASAPFYLDQFGPAVNPMAIETVQVPYGTELTTIGWAIDARACGPAAAIDVVLDGTIYRGRVRVPRPDVVAAYSSPSYLRCGFNLRIPPNLLTRGDHVLEFRVVLNGEREFVPVGRLRFRVE
jgi:hypothetical protein